MAKLLNASSCSPTLIGGGNRFAALAPFGISTLATGLRVSGVLRLTDRPFAYAHTRFNRFAGCPLLLGL